MPKEVRRKPTASDYAVIAVAPFLVFVMLSALANFLMLVIYRGGQPARVSWIILMYTMGVVGIARVAIEKDRMYSLGYAGVLGIASFVTLSRYVGSPIGTLFLLGLIGYLADFVIRDCTLIDENADSSDRGLLDSFKRNVGQPGRSVLYLALAALPLYGIGQFFIRGDMGTWSRAQWLLACYLFSALALLVTTSFLGLRRYLRQRGADMPADVSVSWLGGGAAIIALILCAAFMIPVPGKTVASLELPKFVQSFFEPRDDTTASKQGWGKDGADKAGEDAATTGKDLNQREMEKEEGDAAAQKGAPAGDVGDGEREDGPAGKKEGGDKDSSGDKKSPGEKGEKGEGENKKGDQNTSKSDKSKTDQNESSTPETAPDSQSKPSEQSDEATEEKSPSQLDKIQSGKPESSQSQSSPIQKAANVVPAIFSLLKWIVFAVLIGIVGFYIYVNRDFLLSFWQNLFDRQEKSDEATFSEMVQQIESAPRRAFASLDRPSADQADSRKLVIATFAALDAWCHEAGVSRRKGETPSEFLGRVRASHADLSVPASRVIAAYNRIVYGRGNARRDDIQACDQLWDLMSMREPQSAA